MITGDVKHCFHPLFRYFASSWHAKQKLCKRTRRLQFRKIIGLPHITCLYEFDIIILVRLPGTIHPIIITINNNHILTIELANVNPLLTILSQLLFTYPKISRWRQLFKNKFSIRCIMPGYLTNASFHCWKYYK